MDGVVIWSNVVLLLALVPWLSYAMVLLFFALSILYGSVSPCLRVSVCVCNCACLFTFNSDLLPSVIRYMDNIMHFVASCSQSRGKFPDDEYLLGRQYAAAPSVDRRSDPVTETASTGCARALGPLCCSVTFCV